MEIQEAMEWAMLNGECGTDRELSLWLQKKFRLSEREAGFYVQQRAQIQNENYEHQLYEHYGKE
jgi:hypothetical protein